jgi:hypothetical protein
MDTWFWAKLKEEILPIPFSTMISMALLRNQEVKPEVASSVLRDLLARNRRRFELIQGVIHKAKPVTVVIQPVTEKPIVSDPEKKARTVNRVNTLGLVTSARLINLIENHFVRNHFTSDAAFAKFAATELKEPKINGSHVTNRRKELGIDLPKPTTPEQREKDLPLLGKHYF